MASGRSYHTSISRRRCAGAPPYAAVHRCGAQLLPCLCGLAARHLRSTAGPELASMAAPPPCEATKPLRLGRGPSHEGGPRTCASSLPAPLASEEGERDATPRLDLQKAACHTTTAMGPNFSTHPVMGRARQKVGPILRRAACQILGCGSCRSAGLAWRVQRRHGRPLPLQSVLGSGTHTY